MKVKALPLVVLVAAAAALVASVSWALARTDDGGWMMSRYGSGMMGLSSSVGGQPVRSLAAARRQAQRFADRLDLETGEVMRFSSDYYVELLERDGRRATEVLVDPTSGAVWFEYGPAMMWNTRYGMMSDFRRNRSSGMMDGNMMGGGMMDNGMMGNGMVSGTGTTNGTGMMGGAGMMGSANSMGGADVGSPSAQTRTRNVTAAEARTIAQRWLDRNASNLTAAEPDTFPGYYTLHTMRDRQLTGMLSVNATTGAVWFHWWHGRFVSMSG